MRNGSIPGTNEQDKAVDSFMLMKKFSLSFAQFSSALILGCAPLHGTLLLNESSQTSEYEPKTMDFDTAVGNTMGKSLSLNIAKDNIQAKKGGMIHSGQYPNPSFTYDLQTSQLGWHGRQEIYSFSQLIEVGGKREYRFKIASNEYYAALYGYETTKLERLYQLTKNFVQTVAAQELYQIAVEEQDIAAKFMEITHAKFESDKVSLVERNKTLLMKSMADLNLRQKRASFETAKKNLAVQWSAIDRDFDFVAFPLYDTAPPASLDDYLSKLCDQPEIVHSLYKYRAAHNNLQLEKAERLPDPTFTVGYGNSAGDKGLVAGIDVPIPIWNQNQGNIKKAQYEMLKTGDEGKQLWITLEAKLSNAYVELVRSYEEVEDMKNILLKTAEEGFALAGEGYREGKFTYLDVLEAKRSLFEIREKYIQALANYHTKKAEIEFLNSQTN